NRGFAHYEDALVFDRWGICWQQVLNSTYLSRIAALQIYRRRNEEMPDVPEQPVRSEPATKVEEQREAQRALIRDKRVAAKRARKDAPEINREFLRWVEANRDRPFFAFLNYMDAHDPFSRREEFVQGLEPSDSAMPAAPSADWLTNEMAASRLDYESCLA